MNVKQVMLLKSMPPDPYGAVIGVLERAELHADVAVADHSYRLKFTALKLADNWFVENFAGVQQQPSAAP